ncbi:uncharacterized protein LOC122509730 [Leptopilina heterotoma]|uniref:uncharacterized protein LOC122509730 n=1 Tax=Leptopilina heterotoma TaxID=63436 RepID=UPI001CA8FC32|nr:uncharacterized protein LOC122509730 [Leptopilina heterotoma]
MDLQRINAVGRMEKFLPTKPLSELTPGSQFAVTMLRKVQTKYGERIVAELNKSFNVFLPARFAKAFEVDNTTWMSMQEAANNNKLQMIYLGGVYNNIEFNINV